MKAMKGVRALASGMLVLAAICAVPAVSAAQDAGTTTDTTSTTTTAPDPVVPPPVDPATIADVGHKKPSDPGQAAQAADPAPPAPAPAPITVSSPAGKAHTSASASVTMADFFFSPTSVTVAVGDTVTWHNTGQAPHTATADDGSFDTGTINPGSSGSHTFSSAGTFSYICTIHPNMKATVRVLSSSGGGSGGSAGSTSSGSSNSEASAVASPNAAGNSTTLPMTGMAVGSLALVGLALLASGLIARRASDRSGRRGWLSLF
jgi:plastocyanin